MATCQAWGLTDTQLAKLPKHGSAQWIEAEVKRRGLKGKRWKFRWPSQRQFVTALLDELNQKDSEIENARDYDSYGDHSY